MHRERFYTLSASCPDRVGIVAQVSGFIAEHRGWILETALHAEPPAKDEAVGRYFLRLEIKADSLPFMLTEFRERFAPIAAELEMDWKITDSAVKKRVVLMASRESHCLADLLHRWHSGELDCEIRCVIANHDDLRSMVEWHGISYFHVPVDPKNKQPAFDEVSRLVEEHNADTVVLARYMQILPPELCQRYAHQVINIHHSFLPSFAGARPYHQAHARGVKLIGATCHYATADLDAGPIIEQDVIRVDHGDTVPDMVRRGRDIERLVLARGLRWHLEDRVLVHGNKTVVFH